MLVFFGDGIELWEYYGEANCTFIDGIPFLGDFEFDFPGDLSAFFFIFKRFLCSYRNFSSNSFFILARFADLFSMFTIPIFVRICSFSLAVVGFLG